MNHANPTVDTLNKLLRGEISAIETYQQALSHVDTGIATSELSAIAADHEAAAMILEQKIVQLGGLPEKTSGAWGMWAKTVQGTADILGDAAALKALKEGEEHGLKDYEEFSRDQQLTPELRSLLDQTFIPKQRNHIPVLNRMLAVL